MKEIWKVYHKSSNKCPKHLQVIYEVSNYGNVKRNGILIELDQSKEYLRFYRSCLVHRAVAELFIPNPNGYTDVDHIDGNKHNNRIDNLRWVDRSTNIMNPNTHSKWISKQQSIECRNKKCISRIKYLQNNKIAVTGYKWMTDNIYEVLLAPQYWGEYIDIGYRFGRVRPQ